MTKPFFLGVVGVYILQCVHARGLHDIERQPLAYRGNIFLDIIIIFILINNPIKLYLF